MCACVGAGGDADVVEQVEGLVIVFSDELGDEGEALNFFFLFEFLSVCVCVCVCVCDYEM